MKWTKATLTPRRSRRARQSGLFPFLTSQAVGSRPQRVREQLRMRAWISGRILDTNDDRLSRDPSRGFVTQQPSCPSPGAANRSPKRRRRSRSRRSQGIRCSSWTRLPRNGSGRSNAAERALIAAAPSLPTSEIGRRRRELVWERQQTAEMLVRLAHLSGVRPVPWLSPVPVSLKSLGLPATSAPVCSTSRESSRTAASCTPGLGVRSSTSSCCV